MDTSRIRQSRILKQYLFTEEMLGAGEITGEWIAAGDENRSNNAVSIEDKWSSLEQTVLSCKLCPLSETRRSVVFGEGNRKADLMFIGEGPGYDEDIQGRPFVGKAGQLLTKIIEAMGLKREDVYIANCIKCRPPGNRNPLPTEIVVCEPYLRDQIGIMRPKIICALGKFAAQTILKTDTPISRLRGTFYDMGGIKVMPTFHPAYLLRNPADKKLVWEDVQKIMKEL